MNRALWYRLIPKNDFPGYPCPNCISGKMKPIKNGLTSLEPKHIVDWRNKNSEDWEFEFAIERWSASMRCDESTCGEVIHLIGDIEVVETEIDLPENERTWGYEEVLRVRAVFPAPPLFRISDNVPEPVRKQLEIAFRMYWTDVSACVSRIRTAVECMLDDQNVPRERLVSNGKKKSKMRRMDLHERINSFASGSNHKDQLQGLRNIGNLGTHSTDDVEDDDLYDAIDVLEFVLTGVYETGEINQKARRLKSKKSKP